MKNIGLVLLIVFCPLILRGKQEVSPEDYYVQAFNEISRMLSEQDSLSIKRAVFLAEWAYYEGELDYQKDFCDEISRIVKYVNLFYRVNKMHMYKTGKQLVLNAYFHKPLSGNNYTPYTYDYENYIEEEGKSRSWETQFVSRAMKTHKGQCRSLPWLYKLLAKEIGAEACVAHAPIHSYIMYRDDDNVTPEEWINYELIHDRMVASFGIKDMYAISDSAIQAGTYMTPLSDIETVACQLSDLAMGYIDKFGRYDQFTFYCSNRALEFYKSNPNAWIIRSKSIENILRKYIRQNGYIRDDYAEYLFSLLKESQKGLEDTHMTTITKELREHWEEISRMEPIILNKK